MFAIPQRVGVPRLKNKGLRRTLSEKGTPAQRRSEQTQERKTSSSVTGACHGKAVTVTQGHRGKEAQSTGLRQRRRPLVKARLSAI